MHQLSTWEDTGVFDPGNPEQRSEIYYAGWPGQYASFYRNRIPTDAVEFSGAGLATMPTWLQVSIVGGLALGAYYAAKKMTRRGLLGAARRRRRRRR